MTMLALQEQRSFVRCYDVAETFPGRISYLESAEELTVQIVDVSRDGIGMVTKASVRQGAKLLLELGGKRITLRVVYCNKDLVRRGFHRCGLQRYGSQENLVSLFTATNSLK